MVLVSSSFTECACGCDKHSSVTPVPKTDRLLEKRDSPPRHKGGNNSSNHNGSSHINYDQVEMAPDPITPVRVSPSRVTSASPGKYSMSDDQSTVDTASRAKKADMLRQSHMPSGLSVESDPELEKTSVY